MKKSSTVPLRNCWCKFNLFFSLFFISFFQMNMKLLWTKPPSRSYAWRAWRADPNLWVISHEPEFVSVEWYGSHPDQYDGVNENLKVFRALFYNSCQIYSWRRIHFLKSHLSCWVLVDSLDWVSCCVFIIQYEYYKKSSIYAWDMTVPCMRYPEMMLKNREGLPKDPWESGGMSHAKLTQLNFQELWNKEKQSEAFR